jgi:hypothetical protein
MKRAIVVMGASLALAAGSGFLVATAIGASAPAPTKTVTVNIPTSTTGPQGPPGPAGGFQCLDGYSPGILVINHPGGQTKIYTCLEGQ